jgi:thiaminase
VAGAWRFVNALEKLYEPSVAKVTEGPFVSGILRGTYPLEGMQFWALTHYHLINNDIKNLAQYVTKARDEEEVRFFLFMTVAETRMLDSLYLLWGALGRKKEELPATEPYAAALARTNYFSVLALYATPGEIALAILLNFPLWANGARRLSRGLKRNYGLGKEVPGTRKKDTDLLDRFSHATHGFREMAVRIISKDLDTESEMNMRRVGRLSVETEAIVWEQYSNYASRMGLRMLPGKR